MTGGVDRGVDRSCKQRWGLGWAAAPAAAACRHTLPLASSLTCPCPPPARPAPSPQGEVVLVRQTDQPGIIAAVSSEFAKAAINISFMTVSRVSKGREAIMAIGVDETPSPAVSQPSPASPAQPANQQTNWVAASPTQPSQENSWVVPRRPAPLPAGLRPSPPPSCCPLLTAGVLLLRRRCRGAAQQPGCSLLAAACRLPPHPCFPACRCLCLCVSLQVVAAISQVKGIQEVTTFSEKRAA